MSAADTYLLLRAFCDELARCGTRDACTSPGSRSAPLVLSLVREPRIRCWSHIDERSAGFFAVGAAKASGRPVAVACTSGTAAANLMPAVIEAHHSGAPLLVLTADRPPELREVGAGQAIDQLKLYGAAVRWFFEVGMHEASASTLRWIRTLACRAYWTAAEGGPVHLNFPLREPLVLDEPLPPDAAPGRPEGRPWVSHERPSPPPSRRALPARSVIVAGAGAPADLPDLAARAGVPLLADPLSGARRGAAAVAHYDLLLRDPHFADAHQPQGVVRFGDLPTSKPLRQWLARLDVEQLAIHPTRSWQDPDGVVSERVAAADVVLGPPEDAWLGRWRAADEAAAIAIDATLGEELSEPLVARELTAELPPEATLFVASSMPIRDVEEFAGVAEHPARVLANRGANGIDGTVSAAFGAAAVSRGQVVLLTGDLALLHDLAGLLAARRLRLELTLVVLNNDGGGIFSFLPIARERDAFEDHIATPHGLDLEAVAAVFGCGYERPGDLGAIGQAIAAGGTTIIEVRTDRERNLALHREVEAAVREALNPPAAAAAPGA